MSHFERVYSGNAAGVNDVDQLATPTFMDIVKLRVVVIFNYCYARDCWC